MSLRLTSSPSIAARAILCALTMLVAFPSPVVAQLRVSRLFSDGIVLQRDIAAPVWGWAKPGTRVTVTFDGRAHSALADASGAWRVSLPPMKAGGPHEMAITIPGERRDVRDILVGDVWICSGQSNMEWSVADSRDGAREVAAANDPKIRHFKVPQSWAESPEEDVAGGSWQLADPAHVGAFTAVGYFFARELRKSHDVPIGLLNTSWGGSRIEPWMSRAALGIDDKSWAAIQQTERDYTTRQRDALRAVVGELPRTDGGLVDGRARWADPALDDNGWSNIAVPKLWEQAGFEGMDGVAWYRTSFTLTADEAAAGVRLGLGMIDDSDISWVNGVEVGRTTNAWNRARLYDVPASALRAGRNVVAVRVEDTGGGGGIAGEANQLFYQVGGQQRQFPSQWRFKVGVVTLGSDGQHTNKIQTLLYNKMVHPLVPFGIKGVLWYQGESNADRYEDAVAYRGLFSGLITSWRREWGQGDFPFLWVQLANFMAPSAEPPDRSAWAALREAQSAALSLPNTGQAVIIDIGETDDIHPKNKQDVGTRLALAARHVAFRETLVYSGPTYRRHVVKGATVEVELDHVGEGLMSGAHGDGGTQLKGFAIAGADRKFVWADARIEGRRVVVRSDRVPKPVAVRYAWGDNPLDANLYNRAGLPAAPFRTDGW